MRWKLILRAIVLCFLLAVPGFAAAQVVEYQSQPTFTSATNVPNQGVFPQYSATGAVATFPAGVTAFEDTYISNYTPMTVEVETTNGKNYFFAAPATTDPANTGQQYGYLGFTSATPISSIVYSSSALNAGEIYYGTATPGRVVSGAINSLPSNITLSNATLLVAQTDAGGTSYDAYPLNLVAQNGGQIPPPPVYVFNSPTIPYDPGATEAMTVMATYFNSTTQTSGLADLVAQSGGITPPPRA